MSDKTDHPPLPDAFAALGVRKSVLLGLAEAQYITPSEIQSLLIPRALAGVDILGQARTGTGKTASFGIPILCKVERGLATQALILVPTRELCVQVEEEIQRLGKHTPLRVTAVYGGQKIVAQMKHLKHGPEILVGTPGRVIDLLDRRIIDFHNIRFVVLDEVDRMLDIGFRDDIRNILSRVRGVRRVTNEELGMRPTAEDETPDPGLAGTPASLFSDDNVNDQTETNDTPATNDTTATRDAGVPAKQRGHQTMFVSATISDEIERLSRKFMREPIEKLIAPGADEKPTVEKVEQYYCSVQPWDKYRCLRALLKQEQPELAIIFCRTKHGAEKLAHKLTTDGIECREIHGNLAQNKREKVMKNFKSGKFDVLVATDLASRGIDVADITHIINYDIPDDPEAYVHRVGRTARMGKGGKAFTFVTKEQGDELTKVENLINMIVPQANIANFEARPTPSDWTESKPGFGQRGGPMPVDVPDAAPSSEPPASDTPPAPSVAPRPRTIGSKTPLTRRHKRRR